MSVPYALEPTPKLTCSGPWSTYHKTVPKIMVPGWVAYILLSTQGPFKHGQGARPQGGIYSALAGAKPQTLNHNPPKLT